MTNRAQQDWRAFRLYKMPGFEICESETQITITYWQYSLEGIDRFIKLVPVTVSIEIVAVVFMTMLLERYMPFAIACIISTILFLAIPSILLIKANKHCSRLTIRSNDLVWQREIHERGLVIPFDEIRNIDVRLSESLHAPQGNMDLHSVVVWHGPVPIHTIRADHQETAMTLKEGVVAAIGMLHLQAAAKPKKVAGWE